MLFLASEHNYTTSQYHMFYYITYKCIKNKAPFVCSIVLYYVQKYKTVEGSEPDTTGNIPTSLKLHEVFHAHMNMKGIFAKKASILVTIQSIVENT